MINHVCLEPSCQGGGADYPAFSPAVEVGIYSPVSDAEEIARHTEQANACHQTVADAEQSTLTAACACGKHLVEAKALAGHGNFKNLVLSRLKFGERSARRYMETYRHWDAVLEKQKADPDGMRCYADAIRLVRDILQVEREAREGKTVSLTELPTTAATPAPVPPMIPGRPSGDMEPDPAVRPTARDRSRLTDRRAGGTIEDGVLVDNSSLPAAPLRSAGGSGRAAVRIHDPAEPTRLEDVTAEHERRRAEADAVPDDEWVRALPLHAQLDGDRRAAFVEDALLWRRLRPEVEALSRRLAELTRPRNKNSRVRYLAESLLKAGTPEDWERCPEKKEGGCAGRGVVGFAGETVDCKQCLRRGYLLP